MMLTSPARGLILTCSFCNESSCRDCTRFYVCEGDNCDMVQCTACFCRHENGVENCEECIQDFCPDCRYNNVREDFGGACEGCIKLCSGIIGKKLQEDKQEEIAKNLKLQHEVEVLRSEAKDMHREMNELRAKVSSCKECSSFCSAICQTGESKP